MEELIKELKEKAMSYDLNNKQDRAVRGAYVDALVMVKNALNIHPVSVSDKTIEKKATELSQKLTDDEGEQIDIQDNFRDGAKWMRAMTQLHCSDK